MDYAALASGLGGLFGGLLGGNQPQLPPELQAIYKFLMQSARDARGFGRSAPMSNTQERLALAMDRGAAGNELNNQRNRAYAAFGPGDEGNKADFMSNLAGSEAGQLAGIDANHVMQALQARQAARFQLAPGIAASATGAASGPRTDPNAGMGDIFKGLASAYAFSQARRPASGAAGPAIPAGVSASSAAAQAPFSGMASPNPVGRSLNNALEDGMPPGLQQPRQPEPYGMQALRGRLGLQTTL